MSISKSPLRSPQKRVRGLGAAHEGVHHWWVQRTTALVLIPTTIWFISALVNRLVISTPGMVGAWLAEPFTAIAMAAMVIALFWHSRLGIQVVIEDYVHCESKKFLALLLNSAINLILGAMAVVAIAHLSFFVA